MRMLKNNFWLIPVLFIFNIAPVHADMTHYINSNVGDRASGLAGAYTAISDDSSGCYYNPAGIALAPANKFSASVNAISTSTKMYKGVLETESGGTRDWKQESFTLLPNYFGIVQKFGPGMVGFSYAVPDSTQMRQKQTFTNIQAYDVTNTPFIIDNYHLDINNNDKAYLFGPSYSYRISDSLSVGGTLYYYYRDSELIYNQYIERRDDVEQIFNIHRTQIQQGFKPILGAMWDPIDNLSIGFSMSKLWLFDNKFEQQNIVNSGEDFTRSWTTSSEQDDFPLSTSLGVAWFVSPSLLFACDLRFFEEVEDRKHVLNAAFATEYYPTESFAIRTGLYTDMSNAPDVTTEVDRDYDQIDIYGYSLSGTFFSGKSSISLGIDWCLGTGDSQVNASNTNVYDVEYNKLTVHISTSFSY